ncbi:TetR family transcriptional regulator [Salinibacterium sp. SYSU T00001]|uniref:TetR/AcrR family transcriptional regulator n=1 Tax=Homoserinimonas sedimenticola TaxID=2986805 RepID=UPI002235638C|nr:TetR family transcriptional regulator [Salinibacterium sedimenticola]MCW4385625.1 TetR family transcriptional regulator [Salinibacterium sedimenticola]
MEKVDGRRARGDQSRRAVLDRAMQLASTDGLEGLSIGRLAGEVDASKSGVAALFGSKEQLQLATVEAARTLFVATVIEPVREHPRGLRRVVALVRAWLDYSAGRVFEGGCFFLAASAELDSRPGPVRDAIARAIADRDSYFVRTINQAIDAGELPGCDDAEQLAFELTSLVETANSRSLISGSSVPYDRAARAAAARLTACGADPRVLASAGLR